MRAQGYHRLVGGVVLVLLAILLVRCAWVSDDAFITLRTVDNALDGYGLRWNAAERVQSYTHPLWMVGLLVMHAITGEPYYGTLVLGGLTTLLAVALLWFGVAKNPWAAAAGAIPLLWSKAFIDFSTSGLENPLTHLLLAALAMSLLAGGDRPRDLFRTALITALAMLTRLDLLLLFAPGLVAHILLAGRTREHLGALAAGFAPLVVWELFSFVYYGSLVPNTAYAKLGTGIARSEHLWQGLVYLGHAWQHDRLTLLVIACGMIPLFRLRTAPVSALVIGAYLYLAYVVWIGGDFMAGRFLTPALFATSLAFAMQDLKPALGAGTAVVASVMGLFNPKAPVYSGAAYEKIPGQNGIVDERGYYHRGAGLLASRRPISHAFAREGRKARQKGPHTVVRAAVGYFGYYAGPEVHIVDPLGLNDPLIARMPAKYNPSWRVGHYRREIPLRYDPRTDTPPADAELAAAYARVKRVVRGSLVDFGRLSEAASLQLFGADIDTWTWRFPKIRVQNEGTQLLGTVDARGLLVHATEPRVLEPTAVIDAGKQVRVLYGRDGRIVDSHDVVGTGDTQALPRASRPVDLFFVFPMKKGRKVNVRELDLGPG